MTFQRFFSDYTNTFMQPTASWILSSLLFLFSLPLSPSFLFLICKPIAYIATRTPIFSHLYLINNLYISGYRSAIRCVH